MKNGIYIYLDRDRLLSEDAIRTLKERYMLPHERSPQEAFARAAAAFSSNLEMAQRIYDYASKQWFMFATPVLANAPERVSWAVGQRPWYQNFQPYRYEKARGMPISCFLSYVPDSLKGIGDHWIENMYLASQGGGIGGHWSHVRSDGASTSKGSQSNGIIPFIKVVDSEMGAVSQGKTRRGSYAAYLEINHPEIEEFISMRKPTGGDINRKALNLHHGINVSDEFMELIEKCMENPEQDDSWDLQDPNTGAVIKTVSARKLWESILETRVQTGEPYLAFIDTIQGALPSPLKRLGLECHGSNLCAEITLPTDENHTAVCCLSSVNMAKFEYWQGTDMVADLVEFLDNVLEYFIQNAPEQMHRAVRSAKLERSIGLGAMGFHTYLQKSMIPFEGISAQIINNKLFKTLYDRANVASYHLAQLRGAAPGLGDLQRRNAHLIALAPNASSSMLCGDVSPSIEPLRSNAFVQKTLSGTLVKRNAVLEEILLGRIKDDAERDRIWKKIITEKGSVQNVECLTPDEKEVFKTAMEIDQRWIIEHAASRQRYICQSQSVNLFLPPDVSVPVLHDLHFMAWKKGMKTLYYVRSEAVRRAETVSAKVERKNLYRFNEETCLSCEG